MPNAATQHLDSGPRDERALCGAATQRPTTCEINDVTCDACIREHDIITGDES